MNKQEGYLTQPNRAELLKLIEKDGTAWERACERYRDARNGLEGKLVKALAKEHGVDKVANEVTALKTRLNAASEELRRLGVDVDDDGDFNLRYGAPSDWKNRIEEELDKKVGTRAQVVEQPFERARLQLMIVATVQEAAEVIKPLLDFAVQVK
jgi:hypothetical protein